MLMLKTTSCQISKEQVLGLTTILVWLVKKNDRTLDLLFCEKILFPQIWKRHHDVCSLRAVEEKLFSFKH